MSSKEKPYILFVAEKIYLEISKIKKKNPNFSNIDAVETFIGSKIYNEISKGQFHDKWFEELKKNDFTQNLKTISLFTLVFLATTPWFLFSLLQNLRIFRRKNQE